jgi:CBS domain-containing protein
MVTVSDAMTTSLYTCTKGETLERAAKIMSEHGVSEVPVVDDRGFLVTMVSDRSACLCAYAQGKPLSRIPVTSAALERVHTVPPHASLDSAHELMRRHHVRCLPVVERTGRLVGILSITDIVRRMSLQGEPRLSAESIAARGSIDG